MILAHASDMKYPKSDAMTHLADPDNAARRRRQG